MLQNHICPLYIIEKWKIYLFIDIEAQWHFIYIDPDLEFHIMTPFVSAVYWHKNYRCETLFLFERSKGHSSGCTTALSGMRRYLFRVYCLTSPTYLCNDNTHISMVEQIPKQCPHPRPKVNMLPTHPTLWS